MAKKSGPPPKARTRAKPRTKPRPRANARPSNAVVVRMYGQGLGDCFLLSVHGTKRASTAHVLIDCGVFQGTPGEAERLNRVADDIKKTTSGTLDLLVATHEHWDHVSGFAHARSIFDQFTIKNVWLSWAENPNDPDARMLQETIGKTRARLALALGRAERFAATPDDETAARLAEEIAAARGVLDFFGPGGSLPGDFAAAPASSDNPMNLGETMEWLRGKVRPGDYCSPGDCRALPGFEAIKVYVLGPPRSLKAIRKEDPSQGQGYGLLADRVSLLGALDWSPETGGGDAPEGPFDRRHRVSPEAARLDPFFRERYGFADDPLGDNGAAWRRIDDEWLGGISALALRLDTGVNNTSLALAFELPGGRTLIFPGDAQIGSWLSWEGVAFQEHDGKPSSVTPRSLLNRAVLYKVSHHGSRNATLKPGGLEAMIDTSLVAMIPTDRAYAAGRRPPSDGWKMPDRPLLEALSDATKGRVLLSDDRTRSDAKGWQAFNDRVEFSRETFPADGDEPPRPLYVQYTLPF